MPASQAIFKEYEFNIDISDLVGDGALDEERFKNNFKMLRINQLTDTIPILKTDYNDILMSRSKSISSIAQSKLLYKYTDSLKHENIDTIGTLENFHLKEQISILNNAKTKINSAVTNVKNNIKSVKWKRKTLNFFDSEY